MQPLFPPSKRSCGPAARVVKACCLTALLNALPATYAQDVLQTGAYHEEILNPLLFPSDKQPVDNVLRYGPWDVLPRVRGSAILDDNIRIESSGKDSDLIWILSPGVTLGAGDYRNREGSSALIDYAPSFNIFTVHSHENSIDHEGRLRAEWRPGRWSVGLEQTYQNYSGPYIDVGDRIDRTIYRTAISFGYELSPKTSLEAHATQLVSEYEGLSSYFEWNLGGFFDYAVTPKIKVGVGFNEGWVDIQNAGNQRYHQGLVRAVYSATEKVDLRGSIGIESREFQSGQNDRLTPVLSVGGTYRPLEYTQVLFDIYRRDQTSVVLHDQNYTTTGIAVGVRQEFMIKYAASLSGGYDHLHYHPANPNVVSNRKDDYYFLRAGLDWRVSDRLTAGASYFFRKNKSNSIYSFDNHQLGVNVAYQF